MQVIFPLWNFLRPQVLFEDIVRRRVRGSFSTTFVHFRSRLFGLDRHPRGQVSFRRIKGVVTVVSFQQFRSQVRPGRVSTRVLGVVRAICGATSVPSAVPIKILGARQVRLVRGRSVPPLARVARAGGLAFIVTDFTNSFDLAHRTDRRCSLRRCLPWTCPGNLVGAGREV